MKLNTSTARARAARGLDRRQMLQFGLAGVTIPALLPTVPARSDASRTVLQTYLDFAAAQNAGDLEAVRAMFTETPRFLWVSDGMSVWGRDAAIERMALFRQSEIWHVTPDLAATTVVELGPTAAYLHLPLELAIGSRNPGPDHLRFLVSVLCTRPATDARWRIAALLTTTRKTS
jgi:ketosteroid isomerase-like protein